MFCDGRSSKAMGTKEQEKAMPECVTAMELGVEALGHGMMHPAFELKMR